MIFFIHGIAGSYCSDMCMWEIEDMSKEING